MRRALLLLVLLPLGCGRGPQDKPPSIVGTWGQWNAENDGGDADTSKEFDYVYVFSEDGTYTNTMGARVDKGTWEQDGDQVTLDSGATVTLTDGPTIEGTTNSGTRVVLHKM
jgi:hypothetical protein